MEVAKIDLRGVESGGPGWEAARAAVTASMTAHGFAVVAHDALGADLRRALFARALPELFALPLEAKKRNDTSTPRASSGATSDRSPAPTGRASASRSPPMPPASAASPTYCGRTATRSSGETHSTVDPFASAFCCHLAMLSFSCF